MELLEYRKTALDGAETERLFGSPAVSQPGQGRTVRFHGTTRVCAQGAPGQPYTHEGAVDKTGEGTLLRILTMRAHMRAGGPRWTSRAAAAGADAADGGPKLIPRIIHQTYRSGAIPGHLRPAMHSWRRANEDWEIRFYDDEACGAFVAREFPEYLDAYRGLAKDVERSDFFRSVRGSREP